MWLKLVGLVEDIFALLGYLRDRKQQKIGAMEQKEKDDENLGNVIRDDTRALAPGDAAKQLRDAGWEKPL